MLDCKRYDSFLPTMVAFQPLQWQQLTFQPFCMEYAFDRNICSINASLRRIVLPLTFLVYNKCPHELHRYCVRFDALLGYSLSQRLLLSMWDVVIKFHVPMQLQQYHHQQQQYQIARWD